MIEMDRKQVQVEDLICKPPEFFAVYLLEVHCGLWGGSGGGPAL